MVNEVPKYSTSGPILTVNTGHSVLEVHKNYGVIPPFTKSLTSTHFWDGKPIPSMEIVDIARTTRELHNLKLFAHGLQKLIHILEVSSVDELTKMNKGEEILKYFVTNAENYAYTLRDNTFFMRLQMAAETNYYSKGTLIYTCQMVHNLFFLERDYVIWSKQMEKTQEMIIEHKPAEDNSVLESELDDLIKERVTIEQAVDRGSKLFEEIMKDAYMVQWAQLAAKTIGVQYKIKSLGVIQYLDSVEISPFQF